VLLNVVGFPEAEGAEGLIALAAGPEAFANQEALLALAGEPLMTNAIVGANGAASGALVGAAVGAGFTQSTCRVSGQNSIAGH
jgi:hypothetical protein